jgi:hypothetical protein
MERTFVNETTGVVIKRDKVSFRLKPDRSMKIYNSRGRPWLEIAKRQAGGHDKKKKIFETGDEESVSFEEQRKKQSSTTLISREYHYIFYMINLS